MRNMLPSLFLVTALFVAFDVSASLIENDEASQRECAAANTVNSNSVPVQVYATRNSKFSSTLLLGLGEYDGVKRYPTARNEKLSLIFDSK